MLWISLRVFHHTGGLKAADMDMRGRLVVYHHIGGLEVLPILPIFLPFVIV